MKGTRLLLRKARLGETPQAQAEEAPRPPLDKRVTGAEINMQFLVKPHLRGAWGLVQEYHLMKDTFSYPFCLQSEPANIKWRAFFYLVHPHLFPVHVAHPCGVNKKTINR